MGVHTAHGNARCIEYRTRPDGNTLQRDAYCAQAVCGASADESSLQNAGVGFAGKAQDQLCVPGLNIPIYDFDTDTALKNSASLGNLGLNTMPDANGNAVAGTKRCTPDTPCRWMLWSEPSGDAYGRAEEGSILTVQCKGGYVLEKGASVMMYNEPDTKANRVELMCLDGVLHQ